MKTKIILMTTLLALAILATGCPDRVNIGKINANPSKYNDKEVVIAGRVTNSFGVPFVGGIYKLEDSSGSIWVLSNKNVPSKGAEVGLKGRVQDGVNFSGRNYGLGVVESERRVK